jgi:hypothetical protein
MQIKSRFSSAEPRENGGDNIGAHIVIGEINLLF